MCANITARSKRKRRTSRFRNDMPVAWHRIPARALALVRLYDLYEQKEQGGEHLDAWIDVHNVLLSLSLEEYRLIMRWLLSKDRATFDSQHFSRITTTLALAMRWTVAKEVRNRKHLFGRFDIAIQQFVQFVRNAMNGV